MLPRTAPTVSFPKHHAVSKVHPKPADVSTPQGLTGLQRNVSVGDWLWLCRSGAERDVCEELALQKINARPIAQAIVVSSGLSAGKPLVFVRQSLRVKKVLPPDAQVIVSAMRAELRLPVAVHVFAPDSDEGNLWSAECDKLHRKLTELLLQTGTTVLESGQAALQAQGLLLQVCFLDARNVAVGLDLASKALSVFPGGRQRFRKHKDAPSRSARKLEEALSMCGHTPGAEEVCVDLGAAPGGWSQVLVERGCHVVAIDPGALAPLIARRVEHLRQNAFEFFPEIPADWVVCDMAYRPLEVAALLARWGRRRWARFLVANFKLPMKKRVEMVGRIREILVSGGWTGLKMRQLYHDREEITVVGWRGFGLDTRGENKAPETTAHKTAHKTRSRTSETAETPRGAKPKKTARASVGRGKRTDGSQTSDKTKSKSQASQGGRRGRPSGRDERGARPAGKAKNHGRRT